MNIGKNIKKYRKKANLTQRELAQKCDVAVGTIQQYELGKRTPRAEIAFKIASTLGISVEDLYLAQQLTNEFTPTQDTLQILGNASDELSEHFKNLNQDGQEKAVELVELLTKVPEYQKTTNI